MSTLSHRGTKSWNFSLKNALKSDRNEDDATRNQTRGNAQTFADNEAKKIESTRSKNTTSSSAEQRKLGQTEPSCETL
ncbi:hypothetical protein NPIL_173751 [Nephila pilipes]|uniref:Uncharacterized protein n=1 Tax=Nephila pilipes TaxID=299642 RepID=A0A8X6MUC3_NEPPI|nr:hypothetical protein NPIL_173751 [Nephila pilipes]